MLEIINSKRVAALEMAAAGSVGIAGDSTRHHLDFVSYLPGYLLTFASAAPAKNWSSRSKRDRHLQLTLSVKKEWCHW